MPLFSKYQTIVEFLQNPFRSRDNQIKNLGYDERYKNFIAKHKIIYQATTTLGDDYYIHCKVPSETIANVYYDVVLRFFTDNIISKTNRMLTAYNVQFFSNSPAFMYKHAYIYNKAGYLIDTLYDKIDVSYINTPPKDGNETKSYENTIYYVCKFLLDNRYNFLSKNDMVKRKEVKVDKFFNSINDFKTKKLERFLIDNEKKTGQYITKDKIIDRDVDDRKEKAKPHKTGTYVAKLPKKGAGGRVVKKTATKSTTKKN